MASTILIVDDDKDVLELVRFIAVRDGYRIVTAGDGKEGLELAEQEKPQLIVMDIMMPELDGHSATVTLSQQVSTRDIPVIILTAKGNMRAAFELTPNVIAYIEKPFDHKHLSDIIRRTLPPAKN
jgi:two-component system alkaline phosphatase synthesis response regulator PhoP